MNALEKGLLHGIPYAEGAAFFIRLKTAEWTDPPDEEGVLEGQFAVPVEQVVFKLRQVIAAKARLMLAFYTYAQSLRGEMWRAVKTEFYEHAEDEREGLEFYLKRAAVLGGGPVHYDDIEQPPATSQPIDIFKIMARAEQEGIAAQRELRDMVGDENPMKIGIEEHMSKDQHHLDEMWQMIPQGMDVAPVLEQPPEGGEEVPPVEEAEEAPEEAPEEGAEEPEAEPEAKAASAVQTAIDRARAKKKQASFADEHGTETDSLKEKGRERAVTNLAAEAAREKGRRGERAGGTLGAAGGAVGGAVLGGKYLKGPAGKAVGAGLGYLIGSKAGREVGTEHDIKKNASARFFQGLKKLGYGEDPADQAPALEEAAPPVAGPEGPGAQQHPQMAAPPGSQTMQPANYLVAEQTARDAEADNAANYYRQRMQDAMAQMSGMQQEFQQAQATLSSLQQQSAEAMSQVAEREQQAVEASQVATEHAREAANLRIGLEKMRQQMLGVAAQDPEALAQPEMGAMDPGLGGADVDDPNAMQGPAGEAPQAGQAPGAVPPGAGAPGEAGAEPQNASGESGNVVDETAEGTTNLKTGSVAEQVVKRAPWAAAGAGLGALSGFTAGKKAPALRDQAEELTAAHAPGDYEKTRQLAKTYAQLGEAERAEKSPGKAALIGGLTGAALGAGVGPRIPEALGRLKGNVQQLVS